MAPADDPSPSSPADAAASIYDLTMAAIDGQTVDLGEFRGRVLLIVNVASQCGLTPQYAGLQALHADYAGRGLAVLGFPCNQFAAQEPGTDADVCAFAEGTYGVTFPLFSKIDVNGPDQAPLYAFLKSRAPRGPDSAPAEASTAHESTGQPADIAWNFEKFLVGRDGRVLARFAPSVLPADLVPAIEAAL